MLLYGKRARLVSGYNLEVPYICTVDAGKGLGYCPLVLWNLYSRIDGGLDLNGALARLDGFRCTAK